MSVMIVTSLGDIVMDLFTDRCPLTCKNFLKLCKIKYYNGCLFHTVQKDFTAQTGDPTGTGSGGDSVYKFLYGEQARFFGDEIHLDLKHSKTGTVAMASAGEDLNASQFYITLRDDLDYLDDKHTVFGEVAEGLETLARINETYVDEKNRPYKNIRIKHTYILEDPFDDPPELAELIPDASPVGRPKDEVDDDVRLEDDWIPMDEQLNPHELEEVLREKDAHSRAVVLETIGDIPEAEVKPPDTVLFVCKLNPVTEDEDLHTIFSRFGVVTSAEIIRDHKTGDSLCYAFIEFEDKDACEQAYFKMDNALIDDRRIHVDFSQSVAKLWSQYRRKGQMDQGKGCFKCGSLDHVAKDCTGDSTSKQPHSKFILKDDDNTQRGGGGSTRYEMVFDEDDDDDEGPRHSKRRKDHNIEQFDEKQNSRSRDATKAKDSDERRRDHNIEQFDEKQNSRSRDATKAKDLDERRRDPHDGQKRQERNKERQRSPHRGGSNDYREKNGGRTTDFTVRNSRDNRENKRRPENDDYNSRDDREHKRRHENDDYKHRRDERKYEKSVDDLRHGDKKSKIETNEDLRHGDRHVRDDNYGHKRRGEERHSDRRSSKGDNRVRRH